MNEAKTADMNARTVGDAFDGVRTFSETGTTVASYDHTIDSLSVAIPEFIAHVEGVPSTSLPPLYNHIDPDALDQLFAHRSASTVGISFQYAGYTVSVSDGTLSVTPAQ